MLLFNESVTKRLESPSSFSSYFLNHLKKTTQYPLSSVTPKKNQEDSGSFFIILCEEIQDLFLH